MAELEQERDRLRDESEDWRRRVYAKGAYESTDALMWDGWDDGRGECIGRCAGRRVAKVERMGDGRLGWTMWLSGTDDADGTTTGGIQEAQRLAGIMWAAMRGGSPDARAEALEAEAEAMRSALSIARQVLYRVLNGIDWDKRDPNGDCPDEREVEEAHWLADKTIKEWWARRGG